jgi:hypothetical protein
MEYLTGLLVGALGGFFIGRASKIIDKYQAFKDGYNTCRSLAHGAMHSFAHELITKLEEAQHDQANGRSDVSKGEAKPDSGQVRPEEKRD